MTPLQKQITTYLQRTPKPIQKHTLARRLQLTTSQLKQFDSAITRLLGTGNIKANRNGRLYAPFSDPRSDADSDAETVSNGTATQPEKSKNRANSLSGILQRTPNGAWFIPDPELSADDVFIYPENLSDAQNNDRVLVKLQSRRRGGGKATGRVLEVVERATHEFVGTYAVAGDKATVVIDGTAFEEPVAVGDPGAKGAVQGDKVIVEIARFPTHTRCGEGVIARILGRRGAPGVDMQSIIHEFGLPNVFPEAVLKEARKQAEEFNDAEFGERLDLTKTTICTIDPVDARDFDDAISLKETKDGHWHLGVHIADVSHFVKPGGALDVEAKRRGTSVYLPGQVVPMLPEIISNGLASLQQGEVRFTKSVLMEFSAEGTLLTTDFANSAIIVTRRFAYEDVMPLVENPDAYRGKISAAVRDLVCQMHKFAMLLRGRRFKGGALELNLPEVKIELDKDGVVSGAHEVEYDESHQMIEEFMLAANIAVATELFDRKQPIIRRIHSKADRAKLQSLADFVESLGLTLNNFTSRFELQKLVKSVRGKPFEQAVNYALLRSMKQAEYAVSDEGHYALGVDHYCHFTSPIRRYPDLTVHRVIDQLIHRSRKAKKKKLEQSDAAQPKKSGQSNVDLLTTASHCSVTERRAAQAERELIRVKLISLMEKQPSDIFEATITKVQRFGVSCRCTEFPVDGFVHISKLIENDFLDYDRATSTMTARRSGRQFRLGDLVQVKVAIADPEKRLLEWSLIDSGGPTRSPKSRKAEIKKSDDQRKKKKKKDKAKKANEQRPSDQPLRQSAAPNRRRNRNKRNDRFRRAAFKNLPVVRVSRPV